MKKLCVLGLIFLSLAYVETSWAHVFNLSYITVSYYCDNDSDGYKDASVDGTCIGSGCTPAGCQTTPGNDCNDIDAAIHPGATEICDGRDNDCDGQTDEGVLNTYYRDLDGDGYGNPSSSTQACSAPSGYVSNNTDCNDSDPEEHPNQTWYKDNDNDGYSDGTTSTSCIRPTGYKVASELTATSGDCNDNNAAIKPGATEVCDGVDNDCDGQTDEGVLNTYYRDLDGDGYGNPSSSTQACSAPSGYVSNNTDCNDNNAAIKPGATEVCTSGLDEDCDGKIDCADTDCASIPDCYKRPYPAMDYVPQEIGIYDTIYPEHTEHNCRKCHGNSTADRHHGVPKVVENHLCSPCHTVCTPGQPDCPNGITMHRDCLTSGCHSWNDVRSGNKKWHHNTDMSASGNCIACHDPNIIQEITPFRDFQMYPPTVITPTPFSCENCHWEQPLSAGSGPNNPGHPSTYEHRDYWGNLIGYYAYGKAIYSNFDTHHMDFVGKVSSECYKCHSIDPNNPSWDPVNPELIRYCEICHSMKTLHTISPHVSDHNGWKPVGFHAGGGGHDPTQYAKWGPTPYAPQENPGYTAAMQCFGCHGDAVPPWEDPTPGTFAPTIDVTVEGMQPIAGSCGTIVMLRGDYFGSEHIPGRSVEIKKRGNPLAVWQIVPIHAWTDTYIEWELPCWSLAPGNYDVRVHTENGNSNKRVFVVEDSPSSLTISPSRGPCGQWIRISGTGGFGDVQSKMYSDNYHGVHHIVDFVASSGEYTATSYGTPAGSEGHIWTDTAIDVRLWNLFQDQVDTCSIDPLTEQPRMERNFVRDIGDENSDSNITCDNAAPEYDECAAEPTIARCNRLSIGLVSAYVKSIYFGDDDASGGLSCGDTIFEVEISDPVQFELTNDPYINKLNPKQIERGSLLRIYGGNFGPAQEAGDSVRIGTKAQAEKTSLDLGSNQTVRTWSDTLIKIRVSGPLSWDGTTKYIWVEKGGKKSNYRPLAILAPLP